jgi:hypothetical protein
MPSTNVVMLQVVAKGLGELKNDMVFIGGAVAELYTNDLASSDIRVTLDIDCVIELSSRIEYYKLEEKLRAKGFVNDTTPGAPICRWIYKEISVDIMPTDEKILGFSNQWYLEGIRNKIPRVLPDGNEIFIFPSEYFLAAKFEAHKSRGGNDLRQSRDFEDIIYILYNHRDLLNDISNADVNVRAYLKTQCRKLLEDKNLTEGVESVLAYESRYEGAEVIEQLIREIAEIKNERL